MNRNKNIIIIYYRNFIFTIILLCIFKFKNTRQKKVNTSGYDIKK